MEEGIGGITHIVRRGKMEVVTKKFKVYSFKELKKDVKEKVIACERDSIQEDYTYVEMFQEGLRELLSEKFLPTENICFDFGGYSNPYLSFGGRIDGSSIIKILVSKRKFTKFKKLIDNADVYCWLSNDSNQHKVDVDVEHSDYFEEHNDELRQAVTSKMRDIIEKLRDELEEFMENYVEEQVKGLIKYGVKHFEEMYSDEYIIDGIKERELKFLVNGEVYYEE